jgi:hypothetical protein
MLLVANISSFSSIAWVNLYARAQYNLTDGSMVVCASENSAVGAHVV